MRDFESFFRHIKSLGYLPDICIDVGAGYGTGSIYSAFPDAHHIIFEPVEENNTKLEARLATLSHEIHTCGLMNERGTLSLAKFGIDNLGSTFMSNGRKENAEYIEVPINLLDDYKENIDPEKNILLKLDCQGSDLNVLKGGNELLENIDLVIVETSFFKYWGEHHPIFIDISDYMYQKGFSVYDILDPSYRPLDNALGQVDLVFTKTDGFFRQHHKWGTPKSTNRIKSDKLTPQNNTHDHLQTIIDQKNAELSHLRNLNIKREKKSANNKEKTLLDLQTILNQKNSELSHLRNINIIREEKVKTLNEIEKIINSKMTDTAVIKKLKELSKVI